MEYFSSGLFKVNLALVGFSIIFGIVIYTMRHRIIKSVLAQPEEKRLRLSQTFSRIIRLLKILFIMSLIFLIQIMLDLMIHRNDSLYSDIGFAVDAYVGLFVAFLYFKMILKAASESQNAS